MRNKFIIWMLFFVLSSSQLVIFFYSIIVTAGSLDSPEGHYQLRQTHIVITCSWVTRSQTIIIIITVTTDSIIIIFYYHNFSHYCSNYHRHYYYHQFIITMIIIFIIIMITIIFVLSNRNSVTLETLMTMDCNTRPSLVTCSICSRLPCSFYSIHVLPPLPASCSATWDSSC